MSDLRAMQQAAGQWNERAFAWATFEHVALKLCEEAGEVARAILYLRGLERSRPDGGPTAMERLTTELCDVLGATFALAHRAGIDLADEFPRRLAAVEARPR